jgi:hypothetical protein
MKKGVLPIYRTTRRYWFFLNKSPPLRSFETVAVLGLYVALTDEYSIKVHCFLHRPTDKDYGLLYLKFELGLPISVLRNGAALHKKMELNR